MKIKPCIVQFVSQLFCDLDDFGLEHGVEDKIRWHLPHQIVFRALVLNVCNDKEAVCRSGLLASSDCFIV